MLDTEGESERVAFFFHYLNPRIPLMTPWGEVDLPSPTTRPERLASVEYETAQEVRQLADAVDPFYRTLIYTAAYTGLRAGELLALRRQDVDLLRGVLHVRRALKDVGGHLEFGDTKTRQHRTISLPKFLRDMLSNHLTKPGTASLPDALVFPSKTGKPMSHHNFYRRHFRPAVQGKPERNGKPAVPGALPPDKHALRFHDLRHTCASLSVAAGANAKQVQEMLGHSSITITLDRYTHLFPSDHATLAEQLDAVYQAGESPASNVVALR